jgi:general L-amino acid transport system permease protein
VKGVRQGWVPTIGDWLRDERAPGLIVQALVGLVIVALVVAGARSVIADMRELGLAPGLGFLRRQAGFAIAEGPALPHGATYAQAFYVGLVNTLRVSVAGVILATAIGLFIALARLSGNALAGGIAAGYIDLFRNTPLVVQLIFWYRGAILQLPLFQNGVVIAGSVGEQSEALAFLSRRGAAVAWPSASEWLGVWLLAVAGVALALWTVRRSRWARRAAPLVVMAVAGALWIALPEAPLSLEFPATTRFGYTGGLQLTPEFVALLIGLTAYSSAFIAEVFRSGVLAVGSGQRDAALAVGLSNLQAMRYVIVPQALRVVVPPLTSQYLNLTKNSSLAIAIGFQDLFNVSATISNQTGQSVMVVVLVMATYLAISLTTSLVMNLYNRRVRLVER